MGPPNDLPGFAGKLTERSERFVLPIRMPADNAQSGAAVHEKQDESPRGSSKLPASTRRHPQCVMVAILAVVKLH